MTNMIHCVLKLPYLFRIRRTTYERLKLLRGGVLSSVLRHILSRDPIAPILIEQHFPALDRRLEDVIKTIENCIARFGDLYVLQSDDWYSMVT